MIQKTLYTLKTLYRQDLKVDGYQFGGNEKTVCIVGAIRGNEYQQIYVCSRLIRALQTLEEHGLINGNHGILVIPSVNHFSMNVGKRFWATDNTDINRMFPGYDQGETTQRIADGLFSQVKDYQYGIQFASFYLPGDFVPHIRLMDTGFQDEQMAAQFGLKYIIKRKPNPIDTTTLNYNWQIWNTKAFSLYTSETDCIDETSAQEAVSAVLHFLEKQGVVNCTRHSGYISDVVCEETMVPIIAQAGGIYHRLCHPGDLVRKGGLMAQVIDPYTGEIVLNIEAPIDGTVFFAHKAPLIMGHTVAFRIIEDRY